MSESQNTANPKSASESPPQAIAFESLFSDTAAETTRQYRAGALGEVDDDPFGVVAAANAAKAANTVVGADRTQVSAADAQATSANDHSTQQSVDAALSTAPSASVGFLSNLWWALLLALFVPVQWDRIRYSWLNWSFFVGVCLFGPTVVAIGSGVFDSGYQHGLDLASFSGAVFPLGLLMIFAVFVAAAFRRGAYALALTQTMAMALAVIELVRTAIYSWFDHPPVEDLVRQFLTQSVGLDADQQWVSLSFASLGEVWIALVAGIIAMRFVSFTGVPRNGATSTANVTTHSSAEPKRLAPLLLGLFSIAPILIAVPYPASMWQVKNITALSPAADTSYESPASEDSLYSQPARLEAALKGVKPERAGVTDLYGVSFAGFATQSVFANEVAQVDGILRKGFDAQGRTLTLVNDRRDVNQLLATNTALSQVIMGVARRMNVDEDIFVLFLTSHGTINKDKGHQFVIEHPPLSLSQLEPAELRRMLDTSGIKHRVIVVSACYSGGFVDALKNDDTLVITAAAKDRTSFGCEDKNEWTYFGRAYFDEALRSDVDFIKAFSNALPVVEKREKAQGFQPSQPQMEVGDNIHKKLVAFYKERDAREAAERLKRASQTQDEPDAVYKNR